jgi:cobalt-precorrin-5B (C1)-methyltransferase
MILIFGGTTEGRKVAAVCDEAAKPFYYSTKNDLQKVQTANGIQITGGLDEQAMTVFCREKDIRLIVDAAHPFAEVLHQYIATVSKQLNIPVIRYERNYPERDKNLLWFDSYNDATDYLNQNNINKLLALTGVNTISKLKPYWQHHDCWFRILDRDGSRSVIAKEGFPADKVLYYRQGEDEIPLFRQLTPQAIITKESGESGGFNEKVDAGRQLNIPVLIVKRPVLSSSFIPVYGENGLRKQIEKSLPAFFELKTGYTTGTCATAATKAALIALLTGKEQQSVDITLPNGERINLTIHSTSFGEDKVSCSLLKNAGDDPDVTNGQEIISTVQFNTSHKEIRFLQGEGVGIVTLPGLGLEIGGPAINKTPRMMMEREVAEVMNAFKSPLGDLGVDITISVPAGEEIAKKTFNPKLGVVGGISIIGTSGVVKPFSSEAFIASIRREMQVTKALGCKHIIINSGAKSERFIKQRYPDLPAQAFIHYGNFIGETIHHASELGFDRLTMGIMIGKAVKLAEGSLDTHSKKVVMNKDFLIQVAQEAGCTTTTIEAIHSITMARQLWDIIPESEQAFFSLIIKRCYDVCRPLFVNGNMEILLIGEEGKAFC